MARIFQQNRNWTGEYAREKGPAGGESSRTKCLLSDGSAKPERVGGEKKRARKPVELCVFQSRRQ